MHKSVQSNLCLAVLQIIFSTFSGSSKQNLTKFILLILLIDDSRFRFAIVFGFFFTILIHFNNSYVFAMGSLLIFFITNTWLMALPSLGGCSRDIRSV